MKSWDLFTLQLRPLIEKQYCIPIISSNGLLLYKTLVQSIFCFKHLFLTMDLVEKEVLPILYFGYDDF
jgi:hypothetical protein